MHYYKLPFGRTEIYMVYRIYVEKKPEHAVEAKGILHEIRHLLRLKNVTGLRLLNRYDVEDVSKELFENCIDIVFSEPQLDNTYESLDTATAKNAEKAMIFATELLPGQFDQRADSAAECMQLISCENRPSVAFAKVFLLYGDISEENLVQIKKHLINPVEAREANLEQKQTLHVDYALPTSVETLDGFIEKSATELAQMREDYGLAMDDADLAFCQNYFKSENRNPTITEIRMIDTYWSDHCRHTTFGTVLNDIAIEDEYINSVYEQYKALRSDVHGEKISKKPITLMDMATIGAKHLKKQGILKNMDESDEINACSVNIKVDVNGKDEDWLLLFKNETHNHPTEIEPFGGAATCIGGAIRDPLANRGYVYQAMRVTGAANPLVSIKDTIPGKLPQRKLVQTAAAGYSSYGNQIGLATGMVDEIYHDGYLAKRMEIGAVVGAVPLDAVRREEPSPGDIVVLLGGKTGRDGCGGATGSSKAHKVESLASCGAEVQKGNAPVERKLQRLFRNKNFTELIKRCNDFGAGGVSVAIGELADGLVIELDKVPKKYDGLDGTELAISESQERMAVVVEEKDAQKLISLATSENLQATIVATITEEKRLVMHWSGEKICDISREFLNTNGAEKFANARVNKPNEATNILPQIENALNSDAKLQEKLCNLMADLNNCSKKGLSERFDATIGAGSVLMPFGGKTQLSPTQSMVAKLPVLNGDTKTCSAMAWGYDPFISAHSPYDGAYLAVLQSAAKLVASGFKLQDMYLTFQEYFERLKNEDVRWGKPVSALMGALSAQLNYNIASIGGKDSMSGTFENIDVPPTLVSFAVAHGNAENVVSPEFKSANSTVALLTPLSANVENHKLLPCEISQNTVFKIVQELCDKKLVKSAWALDSSGIASALIKMGVGNVFGFKAEESVKTDDIMQTCIGGFVLEFEDDAIFKNASEILKANAKDDKTMPNFTKLGVTTKEYAFVVGNESADLNIVQNAYEQKLASVFPYYSKDDVSLSGDFVNSTIFDDNAREKLTVETISGENCSVRKKYTGPVIAGENFAKPRVLIPVFPGTNCEYDSAKAMERVGGVSDIFVINNLSPELAKQSVQQMQKKIDESQIIFLPGGFSGGDEPEGSAKFITAFFRNAAITQSVHNLLKNRDGLMLGICNGFQALIKLGLVPFGEIVKTDTSCPTLTFNEIGRHQSMLVQTRISNNSSPWLAQTNIGDVHTIAISHGEGRFVADENTLKTLLSGGQIATQYVDLKGEATLDMRFNPNGSVLAIEGITSPDGRVFGKMGHSERSGDNLYKNVPGNKMQNIFEAGINYFN